MNKPVNELAWVNKSEQECISANFLIPKQLDGWSWDWRNVQHDSLTNCS